MTDVSCVVRTLDGKSTVVPQVVLVTQHANGVGEHRISIPRGAAQQSHLLTLMLDETEGCQEIPVFDVSGKTLGQVAEFLVQHEMDPFRELPKPLPRRDDLSLSELVSEWDAQFINEMQKDDIFDLVLAANYLDIPSLLSLGLAKLVMIIRACKGDEDKLKEEFNISKQELTREERVRLLEENEWIFETLTKET